MPRYNTTAASIEWASPSMIMYGYPQQAERIVIVEKIIVRELYKPQPEREEQMQILSVTGVLTIMIIVIVTIKFVIPRLTWKYMVKRFVGIVWKPAKNQADEIKREWDEANKKQ